MLFCFLLLWYKQATERCFITLVITEIDVLVEHDNISKTVWIFLLILR